MKELIGMTCCVAMLCLLGCRTPQAASETLAASRSDAADSAGKAAPVPGPPPVPALDGPIEVALRVEAITREGHRFIESNKSLQSGDQIALHVGLNEEAYVYIGVLSESRAPSILFPRGAQSERFSAGAERRIPQVGQWLRLDKDVGREDIFVYASRTALTLEEALARLKLDSARFRTVAPASVRPPGPASARPPAKAVAPRAPTGMRDDGPGMLSAGNRGFDLVDERGVDVQTEGGVTRVHFQIMHTK